MVRFWAVLAVIMLAGCNGGIDLDDRGPYLWPAPNYGEPWTKRSFVVRYSESDNTLEQIRALMIERCGPDFKTAWVIPHRWVGTALHPHVLSVACGDHPPPKPEFRGQAVEAGMAVELKPGGSTGGFFGPAPE